MYQINFIFCSLDFSKKTEEIGKSSKYFFTVWEFLKAHPPVKKKNWEKLRCTHMYMFVHMLVVCVRLYWYMCLIWMCMVECMSVHICTCMCMQVCVYVCLFIKRNLWDWNS